MCRAPEWPHFLTYFGGRVPTKPVKTRPTWNVGVLWVQSHCTHRTDPLTTGERQMSVASCCSGLVVSLTLVALQIHNVVIFFCHSVIHSPPPFPHLKTGLQAYSGTSSREILRFSAVILVLTCSRGKRKATVPVLTIHDRFRSHNNCGRFRYAAPNRQPVQIASVV